MAQPHRDDALGKPTEGMPRPIHIPLSGRDRRHFVRQLKNAPNVYLAGQITGVEGYVESAAGGFVCAMLLAQKILRQDLTPPPATTALGGLVRHLQRASDDYQPSNVTWALMPPHPNRKLKKRDRYAALSEVALAAAAEWRLVLKPVPPPTFPVPNAS